MLIGDKGQSGGRRWEVSGFGLGPFSDSPKVSRWEVYGFALGAFSTSLKVHRWEVSRFPDSGFVDSPRVRRWAGVRIPQFGIFGQSQGQTQGYPHFVSRAFCG